MADGVFNTTSGDELNFINPVIWKEQVVLVVGAASNRDHLISRLEAAPTGVFYGKLDFPDKRLH
jgi:hypothetical protein